eukprot:TRINITY_DN99_c2_g2_i1.p1 TRINITY_DN99_c2_g2~~TRINITY_DN99_c2_g2_i1.p1  ORF type:complete len:1110 (-),score=228.81 TRINITY_DN99_c2_g2_i1:47-3151(-)
MTTTTSDPKITVWVCMSEAIEFCMALSSLSSSTQQQQQQQQQQHNGFRYKINFSSFHFSLSPFTFTDDYKKEQTDDKKKIQAPLLFDVIETSNLSDHVGLLNILVASSPLMKTIASSVLFTDFLAPGGDNNDLLDIVLENLVIDTELVQSLLGISLHSDMFPWNESVSLFDCYMRSESSRQNRYSLRWRPLVFYDQTLVKVMETTRSIQEVTMSTDHFSMLSLKMFQNLLDFEVKKFPHHLRNAKTARQFSHLHYESFVSLMSNFLSILLNDDFNTKRYTYIDCAFSTIESWLMKNVLSYPIEINELEKLLYLYDLKKETRSLTTMSGKIDNSSFVRMVMLIPKEVVKERFQFNGDLTSANPLNEIWLENSKLSIQSMAVSVGSIRYFLAKKKTPSSPPSSLTTTTTSISPETTESDHYILKCVDFDLIEDDSGYLPNQENNLGTDTDLYIMGIVPKYLVVPDTLVRLKLANDIRNLSSLMKEGSTSDCAFSSILYSTTFSNKNNISIALNVPQRASEVESGVSQSDGSLLTRKNSVDIVQVGLSSFRIKRISQSLHDNKRVDESIQYSPIELLIKEKTNCITLENYRVVLTINEKSDFGASFVEDNSKITVDQASPCTLSITVESSKSKKQTKIIGFPGTVDKNTAHLKVSRKSKTIVVTVGPGGRFIRPTLNNYENFSCTLCLDNVSSLSLSPTPMIHTCLSRVPLEHLPALSALSNPWVYTEAGKSIGFGERKIMRPGDPSLESKIPAYLCFKESLLSMFLSYIGQGRRKQSMVYYGFPRNVQFIVIANALRIDLINGTILLDVILCPLTEDIVRYVVPYIDQSNLLQIECNDNELLIWKKFLPMMVERARCSKSDADHVVGGHVDGYKHSSSCEYRKSGIPVTTAYAKSPLCSCGAGKMIPKKWYPTIGKNNVKYYYRAAIGPFFHTESLDDHFSKWKQPESHTSNQTTTSSPTASSSSSSPSPSPSSSVPISSSTSTPTTVKKCRKCGNVAKEDAKLLRCGRCKSVNYCNQTCQRDDWPEHKKHCQVQS